MNTIGEVIDALMASDTDCLWLDMVVGHTDADTMTQFRALPICPENLAIFSGAIAEQIRGYLVGVFTEERFASALQEGHALFQATWELVKDHGISKDVVDIPISYGEMAERAGVVKITDGMVSLEGIMRKSYPDLNVNSTKVYGILENIQPYKKAENSWLSSFNKINNENKHQQLTPQTRTETKRVNVQSNNGTSVSWNPSAVRFGSGVSIAGVPVNPITQMPMPSNTQTVTIETWVDFQFEGTGVSAIWLVKESLKHVKEIFTNLKNEI